MSSSSRERKSQKFRGPEDSRGCSKKFLLIILIVIIGLAAIGIALGIGIPTYLANQRRKVREMLEKKINISVPLLLSNTDPSLDPCSDFYQFACGGFLRRVIPVQSQQTHVRIDINSKIQTHILENIVELLKIPVTDKSPSFYRKLINFFDSCMDEDRLQLLHDRPMTNLLNDLGGWPILVGPSWTSNADNWMDLLIKMHKKHVTDDYFMEVSAIPDIYDESSYALMIGQPRKLSVGILLYVEKDSLKPVWEAYKQNFADVVRYLGTNTYDTTDSDLNAVLDLEERLAKIINTSTPPAQSYQEMNISQLNEELQIDLYPYLRSLLPFEVDLSQRILVRNLNYFHQFAQFIKTLDTRVVTNYVMWRFVSSNTHYLDQDAIDIRNRYKEILEKVETSRQKICADDSAYFLYLSLNAMYVRKFTHPHLKSMATNFVHQIASAFEEEIDHISWMDAETKETAKKKIAQVKYFIAYPDEFYDDDALNAYFADLHVDKEQWFQNVLNAKWLDKQQNLRLVINGEKLKWTRQSAVLTLSASHNVKNEMKITLHFLQNSYYESEGLKSVNFGGLGTLVGHELFHAIDLQGSLYSATGVRDPWWSNWTYEKFDEVRQCFADQYSNYSLPNAAPQVDEINIDNTTATTTRKELKVNGERTAAENMADNMGVTVAYKAFMKWFHIHTNEQHLPDVAYTPQQLFWIAFANKYCSYESPKMAELQLTSDIHSPDRFRVLGTLHNHPQFLEDFNCDAAAPMRRGPHCSID